MLLRSSSTPVLGSLLSSLSSESPNNNFHYHETTNTSNSLKHQHQILSTKKLTMSPSIPDLSESSQKSIRRAHSESNLEGLATYAEHHNSSMSKKISGRPPKCMMLETIHNFEGEEEESDYEEEEEVNNFGLSNAMGKMVLERNMDVGFGEGGKGLIFEEMHLAKGLGIGHGGGSSGGIGGGGGGGGGGRFEFTTGGDGGDMNSREEYYRKMVQENPGNPLFLRNYAQFLYQSKQDLEGAEEYYSRAILADPRDGEILSQYAKLIWELHEDQDRALTYFERAVQAAPQDCHVHAAYANFLWETEEEVVEDGECMVPKEFDSMPPNLLGAMASTGAIA